MMTSDEVWRALEAIPGFNEAMEEGIAQIAAGKTYTIRREARTFTWPLVQPKPSLWRRILRWFR